MKKQNTSIAVIGVLVVILIAIAGFRNPDDHRITEYATMRIYENPTEHNSHITISYPDGKNKVVELTPYKHPISYKTANDILINRTINQMATEGYELDAMAGSGTITVNKKANVTTLVFKR